MRSIKEMDKRLDEREQEIERLQQENKQLKEDKRKAIEYIKENFDKTGICVSGSDLPYSYIEELLEILGDKENE